MSRIYDFFSDITNNPMDYVGSSSNSDFEKQVMNQLETYWDYISNYLLSAFGKTLDEIIEIFRQTVRNRNLGAQSVKHSYYP